MNNEVIYCMKSMLDLPEEEQEVKLGKKQRQGEGQSGAPF